MVDIINDLKYLLNRYLLKLMMIVIIMGYIVFVIGLYLVDGKNFDVKIFNYIIGIDIEEIKMWF